MVLGISKNHDSHDIAKTECFPPKRTNNLEVHKQQPISADSTTHVQGSHLLDTIVKSTDQHRKARMA